MALAFYQQLAADLVRDDAGRITPANVDAAIARALAALSDAVPRELVVAQDGVGGQSIAVPAGWVAGASALLDIEYPVGQVPRALLDRTRIEVLPQPGGAELIGLHEALPAGSTIRTRFTAPHLADGQQDTVPERLRYGVAALAASLLCGQLASAYANRSDSTIAADSVDRKSQSELYAARERDYRRQAYASWGVPDPMSQAAAGGGGEAAGTEVRFESRRGNHVQRGLHRF